jgi:hypothetical protein
MFSTTGFVLATRDDMIDAYSDAHKAATGVRAVPADDWTHDEIGAAITQFIEEAEAEFAAPAHGEGWAFEGDPRALAL